LQKHKKPKTRDGENAKSLSKTLEGAVHSRILAGFSLFSRVSFRIIELLSNYSCKSSPILVNLDSSLEVPEKRSKKVKKNY